MYFSNPKMNETASDNKQILRDAKKIKPLDISAVDEEPLEDSRPISPV